MIVRKEVFSGYSSDYISLMESQRAQAIREYAEAVWGYYESPKDFETYERLAHAYRPALQGLRDFLGIDESPGDPDERERELELAWGSFSDAVHALARKYRAVYKENGEISREGWRRLIADALWLASGMEK